MTSRLAEIVDNKKLEVAARKRAALATAVGKKDFNAQASAPAANKFLQALQAPTVNLICEIKPRSPSAGVLKANFELGDILPHYETQAQAISVLTDQKYFGGSVELLSEVSAKSSLPTLCKDFIIDPIQLLEAKEAGAQAVLLIVKILDDDALAHLHNQSLALNLVPVVEIQNQEELNRALRISPQILLINNRNLDTFEISLDTTKILASQIPDHIVKISASGIDKRADIDGLLPYCHNFLIGSSLMTAGNLSAKLKELKGE